MREAGYYCVIEEPQHNSYPANFADSSQTTVISILWMSGFAAVAMGASLTAHTFHVCVCERGCAMDAGVCHLFLALGQGVMEKYVASG